MITEINDVPTPEQWYDRDMMDVIIGFFRRERCEDALEYWLDEIEPKHCYANVDDLGLALDWRWRRRYVYKRDRGA